MYDDDVQMDDNAPGSELAFNLSNHAMIEVESPARQTPHDLHSNGNGSPVGAVSCLLPNPVAMEVNKPDCNVPEMLPVIPNQGGMEEFVEHPSFRMQDQVQPLQVDSPTPPLAHGVPDHAMVQVGSPGLGMVSGLQHQVGFASPVRQIIPTSPRMVSTPSPVREITRCVHQMGCPSGTVGGPSITNHGVQDDSRPSCYCKRIEGNREPSVVSAGRARVCSDFHDICLSCRVSLNLVYIFL